MKQGLTYIVFVIDRSGSMEIIRSDMIGGFNAFIKAQREANIGECRVSAYKFDSAYEAMFEDKLLQDVPKLTKANYEPRGSTALYDSLGKTIVALGKKLAALPESERPEKVLVVTITDGGDNSRLLEEGETHYGLEQIREMTEHQQSKYNWSFAYIGANQDAWAVGSSMGYAHGTTLNYCATSAGTAQAFDSLTKGVMDYRASSFLKKFSFFNKDDNDANTPSGLKSSSEKKVS